MRKILIATSLLFIVGAVGSHHVTTPIHRTETVKYVPVKAPTLSFSCVGEVCFDHVTPFVPSLEGKVVGLPVVVASLEAPVRDVPARCNGPTASG